MKRIKEIILIIIFMISLGGLIYSLHLYTLEGLKEETFVEEAKGLIEIANEKKNEEEKGINFTKLKEMNKDTISWIKFPENTELSNINFPVVQSTDNSRYLYRGFTDKDKSEYGTIFMGYLDKKDYSKKHTTLFGHRNLASDNIHFTKLKRYFESKNRIDFYKKNDRFEIYTDDGRVLEYQIFALVDVDINDLDYLGKFVDSRDRTAFEFIKETKRRSIINTGVEVTNEDKVLSLYSCKPYVNKKDVGRYIVSAKLISEKNANELSNQKGGINDEQTVQ